MKYLDGRQANSVPGLFYFILFAWYSFSWHLQMVDCVYRQWFLEVFLAHLVMSMTESWRCLRARIPRASNKGLRACPIRTEISTVSLNLLMILCTVDDVICTAFAIWHWGMLFLKYFTIFLRTLSQIGEPLPIFISFTHSDIVHSTTIHYRD